MRWNAEVRAALKLSDMKNRLASDGLEPADGPPGLFQTIIKRDVEKWSKVVKEANVRVIQ